MAICQEMQLGETYVCENCGLELRVVHLCDPGEAYDGGPGRCLCTEPVTCCGLPMTLKVAVTANVETAA